MVQTVIKNAQVFDGIKMIGVRFVELDDGQITKVTTNECEINYNEETIIVDGQGMTLLPGLFDAHVHTSADSLQDALKFGVTTELEMQGGLTKRGRDVQLKGKTGLADVFSAGMALTAEGGHPDELVPKGDGIPEFILKKMAAMSEAERKAFIEAHEKGDQHGQKLVLDSPENAVRYVDQQIKAGADYIKVMIEDGRLLAAPGLPILSDVILRAGIDEAHRQGKLVLAHITEASAAKKAVELGADGLAHGFIDRPEWIAELVAMIKEKHVFVIPTLVLSGSITGNVSAEFAQDPRVVSKLSDEWLKTLRASFNTAPEVAFQGALDNVWDLHQAGVPLLVGTDVSVPQPSLGGLAHGASVHHELQLLTDAGLTAVEALNAATALPAEIFGLKDRGCIQAGRKADVILVQGDPTKDVTQSLNVVTIWKDGQRQY